MTLVQDFLRSGGTLAQLNSQYGIMNRPHETLPLVLLKYDQLNSPMHEPTVRQCRGIILDTRDWSCVSRPFDKFFNHGEPGAAEIDWSTACVQEKLDGSLMQLYHFDGAWRVGTSGTCDASGSVHGGQYTFAELFWRAWSEMGLTQPKPEWSDWTFLFEMMSPLNRIVVRQTSLHLKLIGMRNRLTGEENPVSMWLHVTGMNWPVVKEYDLSSLHGITASFATLDPLECEGYVVVDSAFNRIKVKHPGYVAMHHLRGNGTPTPKRLVDAIRKCEAAELLANWPEWQALINPLQAKFEQLVEELEQDYERIKHAADQKAFALQAVKSRHSATLFSLRRGLVGSVRQSLAAMSLDNLIAVLGVTNA